MPSRLVLVRLESVGALKKVFELTRFDSQARMSNLRECLARKQDCFLLAEFELSVRFVGK